MLQESGTRALRDNVADLRAQVAANHKGATLLRELVAAYGLSGVTAYMEHIRVSEHVPAGLKGVIQGSLRVTKGSLRDQKGTSRDTKGSLRGH